MDWTQTVTRLIELNTFSSFWYWAAVAVAWAAASHWLIGIPFDVLYKARAEKGQSVHDLEALVDINVRRITVVDGIMAISLSAVGTFILVSLAILGFIYQFELAQGLFVLGAPLTVIGLVNMSLAHQLRTQPLLGEELVARLFRVRLLTQLIGMVSIFATAVYGMYTLVSSQSFF